MKILYVTTIGSTMNFFKSLIKDITSSGSTVDILTNKKIKDVPQFYYDLKCNVFNADFNRNPLKLFSIIKAIKQIKSHIKMFDYDIIHCHTPVASICTRLACRKIKKETNVKVIYTAHGFHFYKGARIKNWILYFPIEKFCSRFTDVLITINKEDYVFAKKHMKAKKIKYVPGVGINIDKFKNCKVNIENKRKELGIPKNAFLIITVGELIKRKNHQMLIEAINYLNDKYIYCVIVGDGILKQKLQNSIINNNLNNNIKLLGHREDVAQLLKISDLYVHTAFQEGLPVAVMEAMASNTPVIASNIRGCSDLLNNESIFNINDFTSLCNKIKNIKLNNCKVMKRREYILKRYSMLYVNKIYIEIYKECFN